MPATSPDDIIDLLSRIRERANQHICDELARRGITDLLPAHGAVLHALFEESPQPMSTLARRIGRKKTRSRAWWIPCRSAATAGAVPRRRTPGCSSCP